MERLNELLNEVAKEWSSEPEDLVHDIEGIAEEIGGYVEKICDNYFVIMYTDEDGEDQEQTIFINLIGKSTYVIEMEG